MRRGITFPGILLSAFIIFWAVAATQPLDRFVWILENIVVFLFSFVCAVGSLYEVAGFAAGVIVAPEAGLGFLGFQGDIWDTQKDMALQALGATMGLRFWRLRLRGPSASVK